VKQRRLLVNSTRQGSVLLVVLVVIALLALGAYSFSELMVSESHATGVYGREVQARACADSGIEFALAVLGATSDDGVAANVFHDPANLRGVILKEATGPRGRARFSLVAPNESDSTSSTIRFGFIDESSKLDINALVAEEKKQRSRDPSYTGSSSTVGSSTSGSGSSTGTSSSSTSSNGTGSTSTVSASDPASRLLMIPGMTYELADAILDFIDEDETPRTNGCESEYYSSLSPPYSSKNSPLESIDELLLVAGVTPDLLYGEDVNRNGLLDPNENDGDATWPPDNADGILQLGWSAYLTVHGREKNARWDGTPRINVNDNDLASLYDQLEQEFDATVAQFVIAYRIAGPTTNGSSNSINSGSGGNSAGNPGGNSNQGSAGRGNTTTQNLNQQYQQLQQAANALGSLLGGGSGAVTRAGIDLSKGGQHKIGSLYELIGSTTTVTVNGTSQTLTSPWSADGSSMAGYLPALLDTLTTTTDQFWDGRININQARYETLLTIPGISESTAQMILAKRQGADGGPLVDTSGTRETAGWLVIENVIDLETMRQIDRFVTARGGIFRVNSIGHFDEGGPFTRLEAIIDTTQTNQPPVLLFLKDLTELGRGYPQSLLLGSP
jgi:type II secretory pathway component PulK